MDQLLTVNPAKNFEKIGEVEMTSEAEIKAKVSKAIKAKKMWKNLGVSGRKKYLERFFANYFEKEELLAKLITKETGKPISQSKMELEADKEFFEWFLANIEKVLAPSTTFENDKEKHTVVYEPIGVAAVIQPWNFPTDQFIWTVIPTLLAGNPVVFKHSEECPMVEKMLEQIADTTGFPEGVLSFVYGNGAVGDLLVHQDIDLIVFTGSLKVGHYLYAEGAKKFIKVVAELGGSAPAIVFEDADVSKVVEGVWFNRFLFNGQICDGLKRLIVHESRYEQVMDELSKLLATKKIGDPEDETTDFGALVAQRQVDLTTGQVEDAESKGAHVKQFGSLNGLKGAYYLPTLITNVKKDMRVWKEEVFAPVLPIMTFKTEDEAIELANDTIYGLGSYVFTEDKARAKRVAEQMEAGMVSVNGLMYVHPFNPFGGYKQSGIGRMHGEWGIRELCQIKVIAEEK